MTTMQSRRFDQCIEFTICCHPLPSSMKTVAMLDKGCIALEARPCAECGIEPRNILIPDCGPPTTPSGKWRTRSLSVERSWDTGAQMDPHRNGVDKDWYPYSSESLTCSGTPMLSPDCKVHNQNFPHEHTLDSRLGRRRFVEVL